MITLTHEEAQKMLDALNTVYGAPRYEASKILRARLSAPELKQRTGKCLLTGVCAAEGHRIQKMQPEPEPITTLFGSLPVYEVSPEPVAYITKRKSGGTEGLLRADMVDRSEKNQETHYFIPLYKDPPPCQTCEALARTVMMDQTSHDIAPPQREWQGLTDEEMAAAWSQSKGDVLYRLKPFASAIESKLREKNG